MENQNKQKFFEQKSNTIFLLFSLPAILAGLFLILYFYLSGAFNPNPTVEVKAQNTFSKTLHVVTDIDYEPYSYVDKYGNYLGYDIEMINEIANRLQMNLDLKLTSWDSANKIFNAGNADVIMNMESDLIVGNHEIISTLPTTEKQYVIYGRSSISSVAELYGRRVASLHRVPGLGLDDEISYVDSYEKIFAALKNGEYEFAICPIQVGNSFLEKFQLEDVHPSYAVTHVYGSMVLHPEDTMLRVRINAVLIQMQQEGRLEALSRKWISQHYESMTFIEMIESRPWLASAIIISVLAVFLLVVYVFFQYRNAQVERAHNLQLQENLETINRQKEELKANQKELIKKQSELVLKQEELVEAKERAEQSSKAKTTFLFNISHDIRTPMNAITGYVNLSKNMHKMCENCPRPKCPDDIPNKMYDFLNKIDASSQHLLSLINDVLKMSRIENGKMELENAPNNIKKIFIDVRDMFATQMETKKINFEVDTSQIKNKFVICDANRLNRVLLNLISNAYKFTPSGGTISVKLEQKNDGAENFGDYEIRVKDTGIGMSEEFAQKVFEAFERERSSTVSKIQGTGLGMAITKSIVDLMHGDIKVVTKLNHGTEFIINVRYDLTDEIVDDDEEKDSGEINFDGKKLFLVEDIEVNREIAIMILEEVGFTVDYAVNGKDAVEKYSASKPGDYDLILMDIQMPIMNGYDAAQAIRKLENPALAKIPIIAMTANAFSEDVQAAKNAGMNAHIAKPLDVPKMMEVLAEFLS
ncbi:MAG: transporter substrate-binding domain-containing protein [Selenomonadaceae bacterium]|nr:transporter substrate-binding domain-containing protein [Selenomonadaceae bacterium]